MACRELFRKLESRTLIRLPPRQNYSPQRLPEIAEIQPVQIIGARYCAKYEKAFNYLLKKYHYLRGCENIQKIRFYIF